MTPELAAWLTGAEGRSELAALEAQGVKESDRLRLLTALRKRLSPDKAGAVLEQALLRQKATKAAKFSRAGEMFFTPDSLEQASGEKIARYRTSRLTRFLEKNSPVADLACSTGGDTLALAEVFNVTGVDLDETRLVFAAANCAAYERSATFVAADITQFDVSPYRAIFFDPARRDENGKRLFSVENYRPPLSIIKKWLPLVPEIAVKISPGVDYAELSGYDCEVEIISEEGDVKEAVLWFGKLKSAERRATLLPGLQTIISQPDKSAVECGLPLEYLFEPDGAVIRAGLVEELALQMGGTTRKLDTQIAYLTAAEPHDTPFARRFKVLESLPWNLKKLNRRLQELNVGRVVVKKRGSPIDPQQLEKSLSLKGKRELVVVLTRVLDHPYCLLCEV